MAIVATESQLHCKLLEFRFSGLCVSGALGRSIHARIGQDGKQIKELPNEDVENAENHDH